MTPDEVQPKIQKWIGVVLGLAIIGFFGLAGAAVADILGFLVGIVTVDGLVRMLMRVEFLQTTLQWLFPLKAWTNDDV